MSPAEGSVSEDQTGSWNIRWKDQVPSTMEWAREEARAGAQDHSVFAAREQTAGIGRAGRTWTSPRGGLYASILLREPSREWAPLLPLVGALAVREAVASWARGLKVLVKWPNDVLASDGKRTGKVAGVLTEATAAAEEIAWVVIGMGVNLDLPPDRLPRDLEPPAVSLSSFGHKAPSVQDALGGVLKAFQDIMDRHALRPRYVYADVQDVLAFRGRTVRVERRGVLEDVVGILRGVDETSRAVVETDHEVVRVPAWDAKRVRPV